MVSINSCKNEPDDAYAVFYNYSDHGNSTVSYVEVVLPVPFEETHSVHNDSDYSEVHYVKGAEIITNDDTIALKYAPFNLKGQFVSLTKKKNLSNFSSYILQFDEPYKWGSLFQADSLLSPVFKNVQEVRFIDKNGMYKSLHDITFAPVYFFNGKQVSKGSKEFYKKMNIERPPSIKVE